MEKDKFLDLRKGETIFVSFLDDAGQTISGYCVLLKFNDNYIMIKTKGNIVIIPMHRVLKIKQKV